MTEVLRMQDLADTEKNEGIKMPSQDGRAFGSGADQRKIRNRDIPLIWDLNAYREDVKRLKERTEWLRDQLYSITRSISGMPHGGGGGKGYDDILVRISEAEDRYAETVAMYTRQIRRAERIMRSIESESMRLFVRMYYMDHEDKKAVMARMKMTDWGFRTARDNIEQAESMSAVRWKEKFILK